MHLQLFDVGVAIVAMAVAGMVILFFTYMAWQQWSKERITIVLRYGKEEVHFPFRPMRSTCGSREKLLELLGAISIRKHSLGPPLLRAMERRSYAWMMHGDTDRFFIDVADKNEFEAVKNDLQIF